MKDYILKNASVTILRPVIFLCGPYYSDTPSDRRNILKKAIEEIFKNKGMDVLPLIVDLFLIPENLNFKKYSVQLMEEICAAVSYQTHILLDTMSSATELGIFANSAYGNSICVYIPRVKDCYDNKVGYFVRNAVLNKNGADIQVCEYRPKIKMRAYSSMFTAEHYEFNENMVPANIKDLISKQAQNGNASEKLKIKYINSTDLPHEWNCITYSEDQKRLSLKISIKLLFYVVASIMLLENVYPTLDDKASELDDKKMDELSECIKKSIVSSALRYLKKCKNIYDEIVVSSIVRESIDELIKHIIKFIQIYYTKSQFKSYYLINRSNSFVVPYEKKSPMDVFEITNQTWDKLQRLITNKNNCYEHLKISTGKKTREIVKYAEGSDGNLAREIHAHINDAIRKKYVPSSYSYAYHKNRSIKTCINKHVNSVGFIKVDIKHFFETISFEILLKQIIEVFNLDSFYKAELKEILSACYYEEKLPLGLVTSPILSDIYLHDFDKSISRFCDKYELIYTRYADDIMISSTEFINQNRYESIIEQISTELKKIKLQLNTKKTQFINLGEKHQFIRYLGVNIIRTDKLGKNYLSVGKDYIFSLAKSYLNYRNSAQEIENVIGDDNKFELQKKIYYHRMELIGKINFLKQFEGDRGLKRLAVRLKKYYPSIDLNKI